MNRKSFLQSIGFAFSALFLPDATSPCQTEANEHAEDPLQQAIDELDELDENNC